MESFIDYFHYLAWIVEIFSTKNMIFDGGLLLIVHLFDWNVKNCVYMCVFFSIIFFLIFHIVWLPKKQRKRKTKNNIHRTCSLSHKFISVFRTLSDDFSYSVDQYYSLFGSLDRHFFENIEPGRYRKHEAIPHCKIFMLCFFIGWLFAMRTSHVMFFGIVLTI